MATPTGFVREFLQLTQGSAFLTPATPVRGTNLICIRLDGDNQFSMRPEPVVVPVNYGGGAAVEVASVSTKTQLKGTLQTTLCYSQAKFLLDWGITRINAGQTVPWTTTEPPGQFASCAVDHAIWQDDTSTYKRTRYKGVKVDGGKGDVSEDSQKFTLNLDLVGSTYEGNTYDASVDPTSVVFPAPTDAEYPLDFVTWNHLVGGLSIGGTVRAECTNLGLSWQNNHDLKWFTSRFVQKMRSYGSKLKLDADLSLLSTPTDRATFQTLGALAAVATFTDGVSTLVFDYKANARIESLADDLAMAKLYGRKLSLGSRYDTSAGAYASFTKTP